MKKGQGQMVAFVLLVGFVVVIGIMVGNWMMQRARKSAESIVSTGERDARCADVAIAPICGTGGLTIMTIMNKGVFKIKLKSGNQYVGGTGSKWILPNQESEPLNIGIAVIPFIEIEGKEVGCSNRALDATTCT